MEVSVFPPRRPHATSLSELNVTGEACVFPGRFRGKEAADDVQKNRFTGAGASKNAKGFPRRYLQIESVEHEVGVVHTLRRGEGERKRGRVRVSLCCMRL